MNDSFLFLHASNINIIFIIHFLAKVPRNYAIPLALRLPQNNLYMLPKVSTK